MLLDNEREKTEDNFNLIETTISLLLNNRKVYESSGDVRSCLKSTAIFLIILKGRILFL